MARFITLIVFVMGVVFIGSLLGSALNTQITKQRDKNIKALQALN